MSLPFESKSSSAPVALQPLLEDLQVRRIAGEACKRHLMRAPRSFGLKAVHRLGPRPAFRRAQDDHGPHRSFDHSAGTCIRIECRGFARPRGRALQPSPDGLLEARRLRRNGVRSHSRETAAPAPHGRCEPARWGLRSCSRSDAGSAAPPRRAPGSETCSNASSWRAGRSQPRHRQRRRQRSGPGCRKRRRTRASASSRARHPR